MFAATSTQPANGAPNGTQAHHTVTALKRWSCDDRQLPAANDVKTIHIYDFDNTLFASPLPNKAIWNGPSINHLASPDLFVGGGWWHDVRILASTGEGADKEEAKGWAGWWIEHIVTLVEMSMEQKDALNVLLTGRAESGFADIIKRMVKSRNLDFHMICLKPSIGPNNQKFRSTMDFKQSLLREIVYTYKDAEEIRIYEDRVKHTKGFQDFFFQFNKDLMDNKLPTLRQPIIADVIQVPENATQLDPVREIAEVQRMCNAHNAQVLAGSAPPGAPPYRIKKTVFYTGYMISKDVTEKLCTLVKLPQGTPKTDVRYLANSILITPKPCPPSILEKVGGMGAKVIWKVTGVSCFENKLWAARVEPVPKSTKIYSENPTPTIVLAIRKGGRPADATRITNWHPVSEEQSYMFGTVVDEKKLLRIEEEHANESEWESYFPNKANAKRSRDEEQDANGGHAKEHRTRANGYAQHRGAHRDNDRGRGRGGHRSAFSARGRGGGGYGRGPNRGRGRGGAPSQYRSLDDVSERYGQPSHDGPDSYY